MLAESAPEFSVVIPFYNEEYAAGRVVAELALALDRQERSWEALLVDDGSSDGTPAVLQSACARQPRCRLVRHPVNRGQGAALMSGFAAARGSVFGMMDGDGQNPPEDFVKLLRLLDRADFVNGIRAARHDSAFRKRSSRLANAVRGRLLGDGLSDAGCALKVFRREVAANFWPFPMLNPFMGAIARSAGYRVVETPVTHRPRIGGISKYGLRTVAWKPFVDLLAIWWILRRSRRA